MPANKPSRTRSARTALLALCAGAAVVAASATTLGGIVADDLGADDSTVISCDTDGVVIDYVTTGAPLTVTSIEVSDIDASCFGQRLDITVAADDGTELFSNTVGADTTVTAIDADVSPTGIERVAVSITNSAAPPIRATAPTAALAGPTTAALSWSAALGEATSSYTVTSSPGAFSCTTATTSCTIGGLTLGVPYQFQVVANNANGNSGPSPLSNAVTPVAQVNSTLTAVCTPAAFFPAFRQMRITNPNPYPISFTLENISNGATIVDIAPPAQTFWNMPAVGVGSNTIRLTTATNIQVKASSATICP